MIDGGSSNVTYDLETVEAVGEKSVYFNMLFSGLYDSTPFVSEVPTRMRPHGFVDTRPAPDIELTPIQQSILENYGLVDAFERFKSTMEAGARENGDAPDYHSCFLALPLFGTVIKNYMRSKTGSGDHPMGVDEMRRGEYYIEADNGIKELRIEWRKIPVRKNYMKEAMKVLLIEMHKDEADILDMVLGDVSLSS